MPADDGRGLDHHQGITPAGPEAGQQRPQGAVDGSKAWPLPPMFEARKLMPKGEVLGDEVRSIPEDGGDQRDDQRELERHADDGSLGFAEVGNEELHRRSE